MEEADALQFLMPDQPETRPPVLGEENVKMSFKEPPDILSKSLENLRIEKPARNSSAGTSPSNTLRRKQTAAAFADIRREINESTRSSSPPSPGSPSYLRWSEDLHHLLLDQDGVELYRQFMESEGCGHLFEFWFACEGLKLHCSENIVPTVKAINRKYIRSRKVPLSEQVRQEINDVLCSNLELDSQIFDSAQKECEKQMRESTFPNFFKSDIYLNYVQKKQEAGNNGAESPRSESVKGEDITDPEPTSDYGRPPGARILPTVMEDSELVTAAPPTKGAALAPLTRKALVASQTRRLYVDTRQKSAEAFARTISRPAPSPYSVYNPCLVVSRQDSEAQSMSSGAHTDEAVSCTSSTVDLRGSLRHGSSRKYAVYVEPKNKEAAGGLPPHAHAPRTDRVTKEQVTPQDPDRFARVLMYKLEAVVRSREGDEKVRRVHEGDDDLPFLPPPHVPHYSVDKECLEEALKKITAPAVEDDLDQDILDAHVKRVWADRTPLRSPGVSSPRPWSPEMKKKSHGTKGLAPPTCPLSNRPPPVGAHVNHHRRKERDGASVLSVDSGLTDYGDSHMAKSRSMPDYGDMQRGMPLDPYSCRTREPRRPPNLLPPITSPTKRKGSAYEVDSGVGLAYDSQHSLQNLPLAPKHVLHWVNETAKLHADEMQKQKAANATSPGSSRRSRKHGGYTSSRSESLERSAVVPLATLGPHGSSWGSDSGLSNNPYPQVNKQRMTSTPADQMTNSTTSVPNVRRSRPSVPSSVSQPDQMIVTYTFCDEKVPYRTRVNGFSVSLYQFKKLLPKGRHGNYKFYFKTVCDDDLTTAVNLEVMDDEEELPTWDGKIVGTVKLAD